MYEEESVPFDGIPWIAAFGRVLAPECCDEVRSLMPPLGPALMPRVVLTTVALLLAS